MGGATSLGVSAKDERVKICLMLDAWIFPYSGNLGELTVKEKPFFFIKSDTWYDCP